MSTNVEILLRSIHVPGQSKTLTKDEEIALGNIIQCSTTSDKARKSAINALVLRNIYLVLKLVHKYKRTSFDFEDLVGYGILGLFSAAKKYDSSRPNRFASYARHWIKESVMKAIREYSGTPKIPVYLVKNLWHVTRVISRNEDITDDALSKEVGLELSTVIHLRSLLFKTVQFDPEYTEIDTNTPEHDCIAKERDCIFQDALTRLLTSDEFIVLSHSCELNGCKKMTFSSIEQEFGIKNARKLKVSAVVKLSQDERLGMLRQD